MRTTSIFYGGNILKGLSFFSVLLWGFVFLNGCVPQQEVKPTVPDSVQTTVNVPSLTAVENYPQTVEKDGIRISVEPYEFKTVKKIRADCQQKPTFVVINNQYNFEVKRLPFYLIEPSQVIFKLRITNNLNHVLRLAGSVIAFQVNSKTVAVDKSGYQDFMQGIILPRQESEFSIVGPTVDSLQDNSAMAFLLYGVVTKTDAAGNATERTNFEWFFKFNKASRVLADSVEQINTSMTVSQAREMCGKIYDR